MIHHTKTLAAMLAFLISSATAAIAAPAESDSAEPITFIPTKQGRKLGAGILLGSPNGLSIKGYLKPDGPLAWEGVLGWSLFENQVQLRADILKDFKGWIKDPLWKVGFGGGLVLFTGGSTSYLDPTPGSSGNIKVRRPTAFGILGVGQVSFNPERWEIYLELCPILSISPATEMTLGLGLGGRYYW